jgi:hypothetical protein
MLKMLLTAWALVAVCVVIHAMGLTAAFAWMKHREARLDRGLWRATMVMVLVAGWAILLHLLQIGVWGVFYVQTGAIPDIKSAIYFSAITYTTTGYGDILLPEDVRILSGVEALTGILMCGLTTGMFFAVFVRILGIEGMRTAPERP